MTQPQRSPGSPLAQIRRLAGTLSLREAIVPQAHAVAPTSMDDEL